MQSYKSPAVISRNLAQEPLNVAVAASTFLLDLQNDIQTVETGGELDQIIIKRVKEVDIKSDLRNIAVFTADVESATVIPFSVRVKLVDQNTDFSTESVVKRVSNNQIIQLVDNVVDRQFTAVSSDEVKFENIKALRANLAVVEEDIKLTNIQLDCVGYRSGDNTATTDKDGSCNDNF